MVPVAVPWLQRLVWAPLFLLGVSFILYCVAVFHIVLFRNPVVPAGFKAGVVKVLGGGVKALIGGTVLLDITSRTVIIAPNPVSNWYQRHSPIGCGYGFQDSGARVKLTLLQTTSIPVNPLELTNSKGDVSALKISQFLGANQKLVRDNTNVAQRLLLGLSH
jgi:hypothetical protein